MLLVTTVDRTHPARPLRGWRCVAPYLLEDVLIYPWVKDDLAVLSSAILARYRGKLCRQNHVSVAVRGHGRHPSDAEMASVRRDFDMEDAEEDNHSPGCARHLFLPLYLPRGTVGACDCKDDETQVVEADGYRWSRVKA